MFNSLAYITLGGNLVVKHLSLVFILLIGISGSIQAQEDRSVVKAFLTDTAPELDGEISPGEWDAAGPPIQVIPENPGTAFPDDPFGGPEDLSFQFRVMWEQPWTAYFLFEVTDDIAMDQVPSNAWEQDQVEFFLDGDDLQGSSDIASYQWWDGAETYGKLGASRFAGTFEGNTAIMSEFIEDFYEDEFGAFGIATASEADEEANYVVEYAVSLEPMFDAGVFDGTAAGDVEQIVADDTVVKWTACVSDDDNFGDGTAGRSHTACYYRATEDADWRDSSAFADLTFVGPYTGVTLPGDYNDNGQLDSADLDLQAEAIQAQDLNFDENQDGTVDVADRLIWLDNYKNTWMGDADLNGEFDSSDFVIVFAEAKYENGEQASWTQGDWNGDTQFDSGDFVAAFNSAGYEAGSRPGGPNPAAAVPEPASVVLFAIGIVVWWQKRRRVVIAPLG